MELRCASRILHGILNQGMLEVRCKSNRCGHESGVVVIHQYDAFTGELLNTKTYTDPATKEAQRCP